MKRKPSPSSYDKKPGSYKSFKEDDRKSGKEDKPFRKSSSADRSPRSGKPRGDDMPKRTPYGNADRAKPSFEKRGERKDDTKGERSSSFNKDSGAKRSLDKPSRFKRDDDKRTDKPFSRREEDNDRPKRTFDREDKKPFSRRNDDDRPKRTFDREDKKPFARREDSERPKRSFDREDKKPFAKREDSERPKRTFDKGDKKPYSGREKEDSDRPKRPFDKGAKKPYSGRDKEDSERPKRTFDKGDKKPFSKRADGETKRPFERRNPDDKDGHKPARKSFENGHARPFERKEPKAKNADGTEKEKTAFNTPHRFKRSPEKRDEAIDQDESKLGKPSRRRKPVEDEDEEEMEEDNGLMTLNKYIAHSGECSRRDAGELVKQGKVKVNGELITDPGYRVQEDDKVTLVGKKLTPQKNRSYILLNKPKGFITTTEDPQERKTVMDLVANSGVDRLYPVGRLDRNTTGLLLLTNDGDLAQKLSHPSHEVKKIYQVTLNKPFTKADFDKVVDGLTLEDGKVRVDDLSYLESKSELGIQIHSGRNRIVRRIFESLGYEVEKLDRVIYAGLTKKNLPRSKWRFLTDQEIILLKHFKN